MHATFAQLNWLGEQSQRLLAMPSVMLGLGLAAVLGICTFLLLRYTRLGRAHLIWKCAVLSLLAHGLLAVYAYGTWYVLRSPPLPARVALTVRLVEPDDTDESAETSAETLESWERFTSDQVFPESQPLDPPLIDPELEMERVFPEASWEKVDRPTLSAAVPDLLASEKTEWDTAMPEVQSAPAVLEPAQAEAMVPPPPATVETSPPPIEIPPLPPASADPSTATSESDLDRESSAPLNSPLEAEPLRPTDSELDSKAATGLQPLKPSPVPAELVRNDSLPPTKLPEARRHEVPPAPKWPARPESISISFAERRPENRELALAARGGTAETEQAVQKALIWLANKQSNDGRWDPRLTGGGIERQDLGQDRRGAGSRADNGITGLALLAFLAAGHTHQSGEFQMNVARGLEFLLRTQNADGFLGGQSQNFERTYCHSMAMLALSEAYAMTGDRRLLAGLEAAVNYSVRNQNPIDGGWRYQPGESGDMSQFGWKVLALHSAQQAGVRAPDSTWSGMNRFLQLCTRGTYQGIGAYRPKEKESPTMTAEALVCRFLLQREVAAATIDEASRYLLRHPPQGRAINYYYWYYGTLALYHSGGESWQTWNRQLQAILLERQLAQGPDVGSWPAEGMWAGYGGQVFSTAMATLCLEVYYRYLPVHELQRRR